KLDNDIVVDTVSRLLGGDYFMPVVSEYEPHAITSKFSYATFYPYARSVEISDTKPEGATLTELAKTSPNSWSERELDQKEVKFDAAKDRQGPIGLAAVASFKTKTAAGSPAQAPTKPGEPAPAETAAKADASEKETRLAVIGDSDFAKNRYYGLSGNGNFFLNVVNWLTEESDLIAIQPKTQTPRTIQLTPFQGRLMFLVSVVILPLAVLLLGISVWARRKSL
ncbi:MAG: Gldg family protein, partial [Candidatus Aminicenantales bacterium]